MGAILRVLHQPGLVHNSFTVSAFMFQYHDLFARVAFGFLAG